MLGNYKISGLRKKRVGLFDFRDSVNGLIDGHIAKNTMSEVTYNYNFSDGALKDGIGVEDLCIYVNGANRYPILPEGCNPQKAFFYHRFDEGTSRPDDRLLVFCDDGLVYQWQIYSDNRQMTVVDGLPAESGGMAVNYRLNSEDSFLVCGEDKLYVYNGFTVKAYDGPGITSMAVYNERLFVTVRDNPTQLWYSKTFDPTNWNVSLEEAGFIDFRNDQGRLIKVVSLNGYLYVFGTYSISRVSAYGDQTQMTAETLYLNSGRIIDGSICLCGNRIVYLAEDGFYSFDGSTSHRILKELDRFMASSSHGDVATAYYNGCLYAAVRLKMGDLQDKCIVVYKMTSGDFYVASEIPAMDLAVVDGDGFSKLVIITDNVYTLGQINQSGRYYGKVLEKLWRSPQRDFEVEGVKSVQRISLFTKSDVTVKISSELGEKTVTFKGSKYRQQRLVGVTGTSFRVEIFSKAPDQEVSKVLLEVLYF